MSLQNKILPEERRPLLKQLLSQKEYIRIIEAHSGISGLIGERASIQDEYGEQQGFDALWVSSLTDSVAKGYPDEEIVTIDSRLATVANIMNVTHKPLVYDGDTGGFPEQLNYLVKQLERYGVSAVVIEDKKYPKSNSLLHGVTHSLAPIPEFVEKIQFAQQSRKTDDFMIIARIESFIVGEGLDDALSRARAYLEAGVDGIMIHSKSDTSDEVLAFAECYTQIVPADKRKPLMCVPTTYCTISEKDLSAAGFNIVLYANHNFRASFLAMQRVCESILLNGCAYESEKLCASLLSILAPVGSLRTYKAEYDKKEKLESIGRKQ